MSPATRWRALALIAALAPLAHGCVYTIAGTAPPPLGAQPAPAAPPRVEQTVGDFGFTLEGGKMITSNYAGRLLNDEIMKAWKQRGYISDATYVELGRFTGAAEYQVTLHGSQYGDSSILAQVFAGLTLFLLPYSVTQHYDIQYEVTDVRSERTFHASVQGDSTAWIELFLVFALPVGKRGQEETMARMGDHLYEQLRRQGAFGGAAPDTAAPAP